MYADVKRPCLGDAVLEFGPSFSLRRSVSGRRGRGCEINQSVGSCPCYRAGWPDTPFPYLSEREVWVREHHGSATHSRTSRWEPGTGGHLIEWLPPAPSLPT